jgi:anaerobic selenocysteine-containing dehydrogenase
MEIRKTICGICTSTHCGIDAHVKDGVIIKVEGTREHPCNEGTLCVKGASSRQYVYNRDRIKYPMTRAGERGAGKWTRVSWDEALGTIADSLLRIREKYGPESVVFLAGYTKWLRPYLQRLAHAFGSPNFCSETGLCYSATVVASELNYGATAPPDIGNTRCIVSWSVNPFFSNIRLARRVLSAKERGVKIVAVDPRVTPLTERADLHLQLRPGTDGALALGIMHVLFREGLHDVKFVDKWTSGFDKLEEYVSRFDPRRVEEITWVPAAKVEAAARILGEIKPACIVQSASSTVHHTNGVQNHRAITLLSGLTGNFDVKGGNWVQEETYVYTFSGAPTNEKKIRLVDRLPGLAPRIGQDQVPLWCSVDTEAQSVFIPFQVRSGRPYPLKAFFGMGANFRMWPGSDFMREALTELDLLVFSDFFMTDTCQLGDIVLPAATSFERSELKHWNDRYLMLTQPVIEPIGESRSDIRIIFELAERLGLGDLFWNGDYNAAIDEMMAPSGYTAAELEQHPGGTRVKEPVIPGYKKYEKEGFRTPSGKVELSSSLLKQYGFDPLPVYREPKFSPVSTPDLAKEFPLILCTGSRLPMFLHSEMYNVPWCRSLRPDPMLDMNPADARAREIGQGDWISLETNRNRIRVKANLTDTVLKGVVHMIHGDREADVNLLIDPDYLDPISGFPGFKSLLCEVRKCA